MESGLQIRGNVAFGKRPSGGSNIFYTDGGTRFVTVTGNASFDNPQGHVDMGPKPLLEDRLNLDIYTILDDLEDLIPYGSEIGGCNTFGDIQYEGNYWLNNWDKEWLLALALDPERSGWPFNPLYFNPCVNGCVKLNYPIRLHFQDNHIIKGKAEVPLAILEKAGIED